MSKPTAASQADLDTLRTIRDWLRFYVSSMGRGRVFFGHGCANAMDEAIYLIQHALHLPMGDINPFLDARVTPTEKQALLHYLMQRVEDRKPASYITGESWLQGHCFKVDQRVIIPRSFIAELLADQLTPWVNAPEMPMRILDLCTGSGCLAILAAHTFENASVDAVDLSPQALQVANANIAQHGLGDRVQAIESDLFNELKGQRYDIILSNPPYVNEQSMQQLPPEYLHEPRMALAGGDDGMDLIKRILTQAKTHLNPGGLLIVELGNEREHFEAAFPELNPMWLETYAGDEQVFLLHAEDLGAA
ncbi:50S ribosomal protein L3 N(5)-glutamine methyltransferase [Limnobacter sp.]|uniref:50S ribosomal protein L3 N(5)-glutamine methyltransferase n=1 Tax=Limnobacter sp. TaxID=2003368 RepID=UPI003510D44C